MRALEALRRTPRYPLEAFFWTRALIWAGTLLAYLVFEAQYAQPLHTGGGAEDVVQHDVGWGIDVWGRWDSGWFLGIAEHGYSDPAKSTAFFPAYPLLVRGLGWFLLGHHLLAGVIVSLAASAVAFVLLWKLTLALTAEQSANRTVLYLALFPTTLFLFAVYSESLYLALHGRRRSCRGARALDVGGDRDRPRGADTRVRASCCCPRSRVLAWRAADRPGALLRLALVAADHGALAALPRPAVRPSVRRS